MQDRTITDFSNVRQAICISTGKLMDACRDQDCMEDVPVYLTTASQETLENATSVKARSAELLFADVSVEELGYREGYYCVNIQYYYRVIGDAVLCAVRPAAIYGLATVSKRVSLFGGTGNSRRFLSDGTSTWGNKPLAVVEAIDPTVLQARIVERCQCNREETRVCALGAGLPEAVSAAFDDDLVMGGMSRQLVVTLGQFSLVHLERQTQLSIPCYDYCVPEKQCCDGEGCCQENPCEAFGNTAFPVDAFFPKGEPSGNGGTSMAGCKQSCATCEAAGIPLTPPVHSEHCGEENTSCANETPYPTGNRGRR